MHAGPSWVLLTDTSFSADTWCHTPGSIVWSCLGHPEEESEGRKAFQQPSGLHREEKGSCICDKSVDLGHSLHKGVSLPASDIYNIQHTTCYKMSFPPLQKIYTCWKNILKQQNLPSLTWLLIYWLQQHSGQSWQPGVFWSQKDGFSQHLGK